MKNNNQQSNKTTRTSPPLKERTEGWLENKNLEKTPASAGVTTSCHSRAACLSGRQGGNLADKKKPLQNSKNTSQSVCRRGRCASTKDNDGSSSALQYASTDKKEIVIKVKNASKIFRIPHKKIDSLRSVFVNMGRGITTYEEFKALKNVSFEVKKGEFFGIIGKNGSGKSTLLKILAGVYSQDEGEVEINGLISPFLELGIGFNPELSGRDNIYLNATVLGLTKKEIDEKFDDIVKFAELEKFIDQQLKNYSSGMSVRLAFSVSIHANRDILLMDEVLAVGDSNFQKKCIDIFEGYSNTNRTVILVTHDIGAVRKYCDRAMLLHNGEVIKIGEVNEVCDEYVMKNMSAQARAELEETERMKEKEKKRERQIKEGKNKRINNNKITNIKVFDKDGNDLTILTKNDDFYVEVSLDIEKVKRNLLLAVQIFDNQTDTFLCGNNTEADNFDCSWQKGENVFRIYFKNTMFNTGEIYVKAVLFQQKGEESIIVTMDSTKELNNRVIKIKKQEGSGAGIMRIEHEWSRVN